MKFCTNCGAQLDDAAKFCTECGQRIQQPAAPVTAAPVVESAVTAPVIEPVVQQKPAVAASAQVHVYGEPVNHNFSEPVVPETEQNVVHTYGTPVNHGFAPPVQADSALSGTYGGPAAVSPTGQASAPALEPAAKPVSEPAAHPAVESGSYTAPVTVVEKPPRAPRAKSGGKGLPKPVIIGAAVVAVLVLLLTLFGGGDKNDPNLGRYNGISCTYAGMELGAEGEWIELKSGGKLTMMLMGEEYSGKWKLDGEDLTVTQAGDTYYGTLSGNVLTIDLSEVIYVYLKEGAVLPEENQATEAPEVTTAPHETEPAATEPAQTEGPVETTVPVQQTTSVAGYWTLKYAEGDESMAMDEDTVAMLREIGQEMFLDLKEDGTGIFMLEEPVSINWTNSTLIADDGSEVSYTLANGELILEIEGTIMHFVPGEGSAPDVTVSGGEASSGNHDDPMLNFWEGDWYGWWVVWYGDGTFASWEDSAWDAYAHIEVNDDYTGTVTLWEVDSSREDPIAVVDVSFRSGVSEYGCMVSESGWFMDCEVGHADWNLDVGSSMVRMFDKMIAIDSYYYEPENEDNNFNYVFILRPWGMDWEDVRGVDAEGTYYSDMMPVEYDSWYLPLINKGVAELPDSYQAGLDLIG